MRFEKGEICVFIPTLNEAPTIGEIVREFRELGYTHIFVMDGGSTDGTPEVAREAGALVRTQTGRGKGNAILEALEVIDHPYVLMIDGDGTYAPKDAEKMLRPLFLGFDHVIGDRLVTNGNGAFSRLNLIGNQIINYLFKTVHGKDLHDILSGYRAFTMESIGQMRLKETGFEIETEMSVEAIRTNQRIMVVPVQYVQRAGTATKLSPFNDGLRIISTIYKLARVTNPLFFFGLVGVMMTIVGAFTGVYVVFEWLRGIEHLPMTILTMLLITVGFMIFMFGVISDLILSFHREVIRELQILHRKPPR
jgi:dolichol-phosphate mannosyltransferase